MNERKTTNILLIVMAVPLVFYLLKILSFMFIPLVLSMFIALLFLPMVRWLNKKKVPKIISIIIIIFIFAIIFKTLGFLIKLSTQEILSVNSLYIEEVKLKIVNSVYIIEQFFGIERIEGVSLFSYYTENIKMFNNIGSFFSFIKNTITMTLITVFFVILWLAESINFQKILDDTIFHQRYSSVKVFMKIEKDLIKFIKVKFIISLLTGIGIGLACFFFDVSFPIFWGLFAFAINFVQMVGSVISVVVTGLFSLSELDPTGSLLFFILTITAVQVLFGGILEPIFMGKSFSINIITILVVLMFWGYIWGISGLIMAIPITVFLKIIFEQFPQTKVIAKFMSGKQ